MAFAALGGLDMKPEARCIGTTGHGATELAEQRMEVLLVPLHCQVGSC